MKKIEVKDLLEGNVHFGHLTKKWHPEMAPYIFGAQKGMHIIDLHKTVVKLEEASSFLRDLASNGKRILFVSTKKQAKDIVSKYAQELKMPYITERWPGGMLTNFVTIRKAIKNISAIDKMKKDGTFENISKRERLQITRQREKLELNLGSITDMVRLPDALFVVDIKKEHIAVEEATKLGIPVIAMVDTNTNPNIVRFPIPSNDDSTKSIEKIVSIVSSSIKEGLSNRKIEKEVEIEKDQI